MLKKILISLNLITCCSLMLNASLLEQRELYSKKELNLPFKVSSSFQMQKDRIDNLYLNGDLDKFDIEINNLKGFYDSNTENKIERAITEVYYAKLLSIKGEYDKALKSVLKANDIFNDLGYSFKKEKYFMAKYMIDVLSFYNDNNKSIIELRNELIFNMGTVNEIDKIEIELTKLRNQIKNANARELAKNSKMSKLYEIIDNPVYEEVGLKVQMTGLVIKYYKRLNSKVDSLKYADILINILNKNEKDLFAIEALQYAIESYISFEEYDKANIAINKLESIYLKYIEQDSDRYAQLYKEKAIIFKNVMKYSEAIDFNLKALKIYQDKNGELATEAIDLYTELSNLSLKKIDLEKSKEYMKQAYNLSVFKYGKYDYHSKMIKQNMEFLNSLNEKDLKKGLLDN